MLGGYHRPYTGYGHNNDYLPLHHAVHQPPSWIIRGLKALIVTVPLCMFILTVLLLSTTQERRHHVTLISKTTSFYDHVQKYGLCHPDMEPVFSNSTNETAYNIYKACQEVKTLEKSYYATSAIKVHPFDHKFIIDGKNICDNKTDVVLIVHAFHDYRDRRKAIRETWGGAIAKNAWPNRDIGLRVKLVFIFGMHGNLSDNRKIKVESAIYKDIVQGDFHDSYNNMTLKSLMGLKWVSEYCPSAKYLVKSDDDMIVNFPYLESVLKETNMSWSIMGPLNRGARVYRKSSKWAISSDVFPFYYYPPYESGSAYIIGADLLRPLFDTAQYVPRLFIDDVYITGILGKILGVNHKQQKGFAFWTNKPPKPCDIITDKVLTGTRLKPASMIKLWKDMNNTKC